MISLSLLFLDIVKWNHPHPVNKTIRPYACTLCCMPLSIYSWNHWSLSSIIVSLIFFNSRIGSTSLYEITLMWCPSIADIPNRGGEFILFAIFWLVNLIMALMGMEALRKLLTLKVSIHMPGWDFGYSKPLISRIPGGLTIFANDLFPFWLILSARAFYW